MLATKILVYSVLAISIITLGITSLCKYYTCGWTRELCTLEESTIYPRENYFYDLYGLYSFEHEYGYDNIEELLLIAQSTNYTYLQELKDYVYTPKSLHKCSVNWVAGWPSEIEIKHNYDLQEVEGLAYSCLGLFILLTLIIIYDNSPRFIIVRQYDNIDNTNYYKNATAPPPYIQ
jgi:hypothetical protein